MDCCVGFAAGFLLGPVLGPGERIVILSQLGGFKPSPLRGKVPAQRRPRGAAVSKKRSVGRLRWMTVAWVSK